MKAEFRDSFKKDLRKLRDQDLLARIKAVVLEVEKSTNMSDVKNVKKLKAKEVTYFRIKLGDYRVGLKLQKGAAVFVRFLHRRDIYRYFP